jgi:hypothetical protein
MDVEDGSANRLPKEKTKMQNSFSSYRKTREPDGLITYERRIKPGI